MRTLHCFTAYTLLAVPMMLLAASHSTVEVSTRLRGIESAKLGPFERIEPNQFRFFDSNEPGQAWAGIDVIRGETSLIGEERFVVAEIEVLRLSDHSVNRTGELALNISAILGDNRESTASYPISIEFVEPENPMLDFRLRLMGNRVGHSVAVLGQSAYGLELWLAETDDSMPPDKGETKLELDGRNLKVFVLGRIVELARFSGVSSAVFENPRLWPETVQGKGTNAISWPQVATGNHLKFHGREFVALPEQPFVLGELTFSNVHQSRPRPIRGVELVTQLELQSDGSYSNRVPLNIVESSNDGGRVVSADSVEIEDLVAAEEIIRETFRLRMVYWFANPSEGGFTYHEGFGVFEETEARVELWGVFTLHPEVKMSEVIAKNELSGMNDATRIEPRWVPSAEQVSKTAGVLAIDVDDFDGDGKADIVLVNQNHIEVLRMDGQGGWSTSTTPLSAGRKANAFFEDLNGDHLPDVAILGEFVEIWLNSGTAQFARTSQMIPGETYDYQLFGMDLLLAGVYGDMALGDVDGDDDSDLIVYSGTEETNALYLNTGDGDFEIARTIDLPRITDISTKGLGVAAVDLDGDGDLDLSVSFFDALSGFGWFLFNDGTGQFARPNKISIDTGPSLQIVTGNGLVVGDIDNDGAQDAVFLYRDAGNHIFSNDGSGNYGGRGGRFGRYAVRGWAEDIDGDGKTDLLLNHARQPIEVFNWPRLYLTISLGRENQLVHESQRLNVGHVGAIAAGDIMGDQRLELLIATEDAVELWERGPSRIFHPKPLPVVVEDVVVRNRLTDLLGFGFSRKDLERITHLDLQLGMQKGLSLPAGLVNLRSLHLTGDMISALEFPNDLSALESVVVLGSATTDFDPTEKVVFRVGKGLENVTSLHIFGLGVTELAIERALPQLGQLGLRGNRLRDFSFLSKTLNLRQLDLGNNGLQNLVVPLGPGNLDQLNVEGNELVSLAVPKRMEIQNLIGYSKDSIVRFEPFPVITLTHDNPGYLKLTAIGGGGEYFIEVSNDLLVWERIAGYPSFKSWFAEIELPVGVEVPVQFFRIALP